MYTIQTHNLSHYFGTDDRALDNISLNVPKGSVYGFLGPNGAGKTTTLRLLLGLIKKQRGTITVFDQELEKNRLSILTKTGSLIESPSMYAHLSATENLLILQKIHRCKPSRIAEVLQIVGLASTGKKKVGKFSLGMKQRLGIAMAMLHDPELLILDEPTNGLDPNGIVEIRELLKKINREWGKTILVSSHLLVEIEKMATHVGIINKGKLLFQGSLEELKKQQNQSSATVLATNNNEAAVRVLLQEGMNSNIVQGEIHLVALEPEKVAYINRKLVESKIDVYKIGNQQNDLESIFMDMIQEL